MFPEHICMLMLMFHSQDQEIYLLDKVSWKIHFQKRRSHNSHSHRLDLRCHLDNDTKTIHSTIRSYCGDSLVVWETLRRNSDMKSILLEP